MCFESSALYYFYFFNCRNEYKWVIKNRNNKIIIFSLRMLEKDYSNSTINIKWYNNNK